MHTNNTFITLEEAIQEVPAIAAESHLGSDRYKFVSSVDIIKNMSDVGFGLTDVRCPNVRKASKYHVKHEMIFRVQKPDMSIAESYPDPRNPNHNLYPQLRVMNSSDTLCGFKAHLGLFSNVSNTGFMMHDSLEESDTMAQGFNHAHIGFSSEEAQTLLLHFTHKFPVIISRMERMSKLILSEEEKLEFAEKAGKLRFASGMSAPHLLLQSRRSTDHGSDLWTVFNVIQENCMKGGFQVNYRRARPITAIEANRLVTLGLYDLANIIYKRYYKD